MTKQRRLILDIINHSHSHPTAEQVFRIAKEKMPSIVLATVYNNLNALVSEGMIRRVSIHGEPDRYDNMNKSHEHIQCDRCGAISDIFPGNLLEELEIRCEKKLTSYELNLHYICDECRRSDNKFMEEDL